MNTYALQDGVAFQVAKVKSLTSMIQSAIDFHGYDGINPSLGFMADIWKLVIDNDPELFHEIFIDKCLANLTQFRERGRSLWDDSDLSTTIQDGVLGCTIKNQISAGMIEHVAWLEEAAKVSFVEGEE